jgi:precorrin-4/cobalt-precorrin-4 C11-methyltransferase
MIYIIGIGPGGDLNYLTMKANRIIEEEVNTGIYIGEMICDDIKNIFQNKALITGDISRKRVLKNITSSISNEDNLAILMPGDSSFYSGQYGEQFMLHEYVELFKKRNYKYEIIPGITALNAICAKLSIDLTSFSSNQNVYITSVERIRDTNQYNPDKLTKVLSTRPNIVFYQSYRDWEIIRNLLIEENFDPNTRIVFAYKVSWNDEKIIDTNLKEADIDIESENLEKHTIIVILPKHKLNSKC